MRGAATTSRTPSTAELATSPALARLLGEALEAVEREVEAVVGAEAARPGAEHLVGLAVEVAGADSGVLVVAGGEHGLELPAGVLDAPRLHRRIPVVVPPQLGAQLAQPTVDDEPVLGEPGAL